MVKQDIIKLVKSPFKFNGESFISKSLTLSSSPLSFCIFFKPFSHISFLLSLNHFIPSFLLLLVFISNPFHISVSLNLPILRNNRTPLFSSHNTSQWLLHFYKLSSCGYLIWKNLISRCYIMWKLSNLIKIHLFRSWVVSWIWANGLKWF